MVHSVRVSRATRRPAGQDALAETVPIAGRRPIAARSRRPRGSAPAEVGRYRLRHRIGEGGMGVVYEAVDTVLGRRVALKFLRPDHFDTAARQRLIDESRALARLSHPNVLTIYEVGAEAGRPYLALEFVAGSTLRGWLSQRQRRWCEIREVFLQAGRGLAAAHAVGLVHCDFKPDNLLVDRSGRVRVGDFGLVRLAGACEPDASAPSPDGPGDRPAPRSTRSELPFGTLPYMAPEIFVGQPADARSDQWSFAASLWEAVCGRAPFSGDTAAALDRALTRDVRLPAIDRSRTGVPRWACRLIRRGLDPVPGRRFASMDELVAALEGSRRRRPLEVFALAIGAIAMALGIAGRELITSAPSAARAPCGELARAFDDVWSPARRQQVESALARMPPVTAGSARRIAAQIDRYARDWMAARVAVCRAPAAGRAAIQANALRVACFEERRSALAATVRMLAEPDPLVAQVAPALAGRLPPVAECLAAGSSEI